MVYVAVPLTINVLVANVELFMIKFSSPNVGGSGLRPAAGAD